MRFRLSMLALPAALLSTPMALLAQGHGEEGGGGGLFDINVGLIIWTIVNFVILVILGIAFSRPEPSKRVIGRVLRIKPEPEEPYRA